MHVIASEHIDTAAAVASRGGEAVLVLREGMLSAEDLDVVQRVCKPVDARVLHQMEDLKV